MILLVISLIKVGDRANVIASAKQPKPRRPHHDHQDRIPLKAPSEARRLEIAAKHFRQETLELRTSDRLDFHDGAVWSIRAAQEAAFAAGQAATR